MPRIACRSINFHVPMPRHLDRHMRGRTEAVKAKLSTRLDARKPQRPKSDDSCAQKRRSLFIRKSFRNGIGKILRRDDVLGVASMHGVTGKLRVIAKIFRARAAVFAGS